MALRAIKVSDDPVGYFQHTDEKKPGMRLADVVLRYNRNPRKVFSQIIRAATESPWSHSAIVYLIADSEQGFDNNFVVEGMTSGVRVNTWSQELSPRGQYTAAIKRLDLDWYVETPQEQVCHSPCDPEDTHGIDYLRHVRGIALDQINGLYDKTAVHELAGLYTERLAARRVPAVADAIGKLVKRLELKDGSTISEQAVRFMCSGLVQYSFVEALRRRIARAFGQPDGHDAGESNLEHMPCVLFRDDPDGLVAQYVSEVRSGARLITQPLPGPLVNLLKTSTPADFAVSPSLEWRYVVNDGALWQIEPGGEGYAPHDEEEAAVLELVEPKKEPSPEPAP